MPRRIESKYIMQREAERRADEERAKELQALKDEEIDSVSRVLGIDNRELASHLVGLGFDADRAPAFALIPLVYVAWADGNVSSTERTKVLEVAEAHGLEEGSPAHSFLADLLETRPRKDFFETCVRAVRLIHETLPAAEAAEAKRDLVSLSVAIAKASGGILGLFGDKVSSDERKIVKAMVAELGLDDGVALKELLSS